MDKFDLPGAAVGLGLCGGSRERWRMNENDQLQRDAVALVTKYKAMLMMAPPVKAFFKRLAVFLKWTELEKAL